MAYLDHVISQLHDEGKSHVKEGKSFEKLVQAALECHPGIYGKERFETIWLWKDWPDRDTHGYTAQDIGIDLVARETEVMGGGLVAIQVKFGDSEVSTQEVDSFLGAAGAECFTSRLLVSDRDIAKTGLEKLEKFPNCQILRTSEMDEWLEDWNVYLKDRTKPLPISIPKHKLHDYQQDAVLEIDKGFAEDNKGQLIMPCGSGKSLVALRAAERIAGAGRDVLYLVPSIALVGQTMREWSAQRELPMQYLGICSDVSTALKASDDASTAGSLTELAIPVTTDADRIAEQLAKRPEPGHMRVIFSTYHSTPKIAEALAKLPDFYFELAVCDEAHRTTGISEANSPKDPLRGYMGISPFQLVHYNQHLRVGKRLFMTATSRVFTEKQRKKIDEGDYDESGSFSMDDPRRYGEEFFRMSFADALEKDCLSDYEVIVIAADEKSYLQSIEDTDLTHDDPKLKENISTQAAVKLAGSWDALATPRTTRVDQGRKPGELRKVWGQPAKAAIAFCNTRASSKKAALHWKKVAQAISGRYKEGDFLEIDVRHIDATTPANERADLLQKLKEKKPLLEQGYGPTLLEFDDAGAASDATGQSTQRKSSHACRVLTNAKVLSEGVDVPALDAVVFLEPRSSELDITQAVGRVMRKAAGKQKGYIVIPVVIPEHEFDTEDEDARLAHVDEILRSSDFKAVWQVARALRSHDERIDYWLNNPQAAQQAKTFRFHTTSFRADSEPDLSSKDGKAPQVSPKTYEQLTLALHDNFASMLVAKCGDREMYPRWGEKAARICETIRKRVSVYISRTEGVDGDDSPAADAFDDFLAEIQEAISPDVTARQAEEMVAQHIVTIPVFDVLFSDSDFVSSNPVSISINKLIEVLKAHGGNFDEDLRPLKRAYQTMQRAFEGAVSSEDKLDILREIYDGFFNAAMKKAVEALGIAYTPVELIDFVWRSVDAVCRQEFGKGLTDEGVNILEPFAGTGTFISRLLTGKDADGNYFIRDEDLARKYADEIHANELILLAYYIAALKIEETKHARELDANPNSKVDYEPFNNIVLTDTFLMDEHSKTRKARLLKDTDSNPARVQKQNQLEIQIIPTNPPWSSGQDSASDDNPGVRYEAIADRVRETYAKAHKEITGRAPGGNAGGNSYVQAFRWASDRINDNQKPDGSGGDPDPAIIAFISPNSLYDGTSLAGMRKCLQEEFTDIYVVNLRGNAYKSGDEFKKEGDKVFGHASRNGVQITVLVRNPNKDITTPATLHYAEVPEYSSLDQKFEWLEKLGDILDEGFQIIPVNKRWSWSNPGTPGWDDMSPLCPQKSGTPGETLAVKHASGITSGCDAYVYAFSKAEVERKAKILIDEYNEALDLYQDDPTDECLEELTKNHNVHTIKWTHSLIGTLRKQKTIVYDESKITQVLYRPFRKMWLYLDKDILSSTSVTKLFTGGGPAHGKHGGDHLRQNSNHLQSTSSSTPTAAAAGEASPDRPDEATPDSDLYSQQSSYPDIPSNLSDSGYALDHGRDTDSSDQPLTGGGISLLSNGTKSHSEYSQSKTFHPMSTPRGDSHAASHGNPDQRAVVSTEHSSAGNPADSRLAPDSPGPSNADDTANPIDHGGGHSPAYSSAPPPTRPSSQSWPHGSSPTSARRGQPRPAEHTHGNPDQHPVGQDHPGSSGHPDADRPEHDRHHRSHPGAAPTATATITAIAIGCPSSSSIPTALATAIPPDLKGAGISQACRVIQF